MILFIFEGDRECPVFKTVQKLFFPKEIEPFICVYKSNIYSLYSRIKQHDLIGMEEEIKVETDTISVLNDILKEQGNYTLDGIDSSEISETYLFFDYDFHHNRGSLEENNIHLKELLDYFCEETEAGKLYINYPMLESLRYTKELPDNDYINYVVSREDCNRFKRLANDFSAYNSFDHLLLSNNPKEAAEKRLRKALTAKKNWLHLISMNVKKANHLCSNSFSMPADKSAIAQPTIFDAQLAKHVRNEDCKVSILNSFPIFIYEYLRELPSES